MNDDRSEFQVTLPANASVIAVARTFAAAVARTFACDEGSVEDLRIAVSEALTNSIKAHHADEVDAPIVLRVSADAARLTVEVVDDGSGIDPAIARSEAAITPPAGLQEGSLGLVLIRSLFPDTEISAGETGRGTTVRFSLSLDPVPAAR